MKGVKRLSMLVTAVLTANPGAAMAQSSGPSGFSNWYYHEGRNGVEVYYAVRVDRDEIRVAWKCVNTGSEAKACSIGAGAEKSYLCRRDGVGAGITSSLGERATVAPHGEHVFPSDFACRGKGATEVQPSARISIED